MYGSDIKLNANSVVLQYLLLQLNNFPTLEYNPVIAMPPSIVAADYDTDDNSYLKSSMTVTDAEFLEELKADVMKHQEELSYLKSSMTVTDAEFLEELKADVMKHQEELKAELKADVTKLEEKVKQMLRKLKQRWGHLKN